MTASQHTGLVLGELHIRAWNLGEVTRHEHSPAVPTIVAAVRAILSETLRPSAPCEATLRWAGRQLR